MKKIVIFEPGFEAASYMIKDTYKIPETKHYRYFMKNRKLQSLFELHTTGKLSFLPFKGIWRLVAPVFNLKEDGYVFIYYGTTNIVLGTKSGLVKKLKRKYPNSKHIGYYIDYEAARKTINQDIRETLDDIYIFDKRIAVELNIKYWPMPISRFKEWEDQEVKYDIMFIGQAKDRFEEIIKVYDKLEERGVKCYFYIIGVPEEMQIIREGLHYGDFLPYETATKILLQSNCVLEIRRSNSGAYANRVLEAIMYNKKILSNNKNILELDYKIDENIQIYSDVEDIDVNFVKTPGLNREYNDEYSPIRFIEQF